MNYRRVLRWVGAVFLVFLGFTLGLAWSRSSIGVARVSWVGIDSKEDSGSPKGIHFGLYWDVWNRIQRSFVDAPSDEKKLYYGSISGMVDALEDPYSLFFTPEAAAEFTNTLSGTFEGIGAEIGMKKGQLLIVAPIAHSPAQAAGLLPGDVITNIDGESTLGLSVEEAVKRIRGPQGTQVTLTIVRQKKEPFTVVLTRDQITVESVTITLQTLPSGKRIVVLRVTNFDERFKGSLETVIQNDIALKRFDGIVLDVRNNPGGFLEDAIDLASLWIPRGEPIAWEVFPHKEPKAQVARHNPLLLGVRTVVLVNQGSASGSEIVTGALQDYHAATIVGEPTYGKGSVQNYERLSDGSALKLTVARWLTPKKRAIEKLGIIPDVIVEYPAEAYDENKQDPQMKKALELLDQ